MGSSRPYWAGLQLTREERGCGCGCGHLTSTGKCNPGPRSWINICLASFLLLNPKPFFLFASRANLHYSNHHRFSSVCRYRSPHLFVEVHSLVLSPTRAYHPTNLHDRSLAHHNNLPSCRLPSHSSASRRYIDELMHT